MNPILRSFQEQFKMTSYMKTETLTAGTDETGYTFVTDVDYMNNTDAYFVGLWDDVAVHATLSSASFLLELVTLLVIAIVAVAANVIAMTTILRVRLLRRNPHNLLILNLTLTDLGVACTTMVFSLISVFDGGRLLRTHTIVCDFNGFCTVLFSASSFATITCISVDRYLSVVWSTRFPPSHRRACFLLCGAWLLSASFAALPLFRIHSAYTYLADTHHCSPIWDLCFYYTIGFGINYVLTIPTMLFCYIFVFRVIWKKERRLKNHRLGALNLSSASRTELWDDSDGATLDSKGTHCGIESSVNTVLVNPADTLGIISTPSNTLETKAAARLSRSFSSPLLHLQGRDEGDGERTAPGPADWNTTASGDESLSTRGRERTDQTTPDEQTNNRYQETDTRGRPRPRKATSLARSRSVAAGPKGKRTRCRRSASCASANRIDNKSCTIEMGERRRGTEMDSSRKLARSESFFSLANIRRSARNGGRLQRSQSTDRALSRRSYSSKQRTIDRTSKNKRKIKKREKKLRADKQVALTGSLLILSSVVCWTPYAVIRSCFIPLTTPHWMGVAAMWFSFSNALLDPLIYAFMNRRVKKRISDDMAAFHARLRACVGACPHDKGAADLNNERN